jgi:hypothetical protein
MDSEMLKSLLVTLRIDMGEIDKGLINQMSDLEKLEEKWKILDSEAVQISNEKKFVVSLNVGGKLFQTNIQTLLNIKDTLFYKIILSKTFDMTNEIYIDRSPRYFNTILDYMRFKTFTPKAFSFPEKKELLEEAEYYEIAELIDVMGNQTKLIEIVKFEVNGFYMRGNIPVGNSSLEDIKSRTLNSGFALNSPGMLIIELNQEWEFCEIEIGGYKGNTSYFAASNGCGAQITTSLNKTQWNIVGTVPYGYENDIQTVKFKPTTAKYVKIQHTSYLGIGFINVKKMI